MNAHDVLAVFLTDREGIVDFDGVFVIDGDGGKISKVYAPGSVHGGTKRGGGLESARR